MGLYLFSGPTWEEDTLNQLDTEPEIKKEKPKPLLNTPAVCVGECGND